jgi:hypothetical protein
MTEKITELTPEQEAMMPVWIEKWLKIGCSTDQNVDEEACLRAVKNIYEGANEQNAPTKYEIVPSPKAIYNIVKDPDFVNQSCFGSFEASWLAYYTYFRDVIKLELDPRLEDLVTLALNVSMYYQKDDTLYLVRKPEQINIENGVLHNESGPAIRYSDGFSIWCIRGNQVTEQIVMRPETLTVKQINDEQNSDIQSIMIDRFGWERYIAESKSVKLDSRRNEVEGTLEALYDTDRFGRRLVCVCPTGRVFVKGIQTLEETRTCEGAQKWLSGVGSNSVIGRRKVRTIART